MATEIQLLRGGTWESILYSDFSIEVPTSELSAAPSAEITAQAREDVSANQDIRIVIDGTIRFEGVTESSGTKRSRGQLELSAVHAAEALFAERVDVELTGTVTATDVLNAGLSNSNRGSNFTLDWSGTDTTLQSDYTVDNRQLSQLFRDMCDRTGRLWWVDPAGSTIHVEPRGGRGTWQSLDARDDGIGVQSWDDGSVKTVRNDVVVNATAGENVTGSDSDATSIATYGRRSEDINISYAATQAEADAYATELLIPEPLSQGEIDVPQSVGNIVQPLTNYTVDLVDAAKGIDTTDQVVEKQTIQQGRVRLKIGEGSAVSMANVQRNAKSNEDENPPGTIMPADRIGDRSIVESKLEDLSVSIDKIQDEAVAEAKVRTDAITETKVQDDAIATPKLQAGSITSGKIDTAAVDAIHIQADAVEAGKVDADAIGAREIIANEITADEIATLSLGTNQIEINGDNSTLVFGSSTGASGDFFEIYGTGTLDTVVLGGLSKGGQIAIVSNRTNDMDELVPYSGDGTGNVGSSDQAYGDVYAYNFIDASTGSAINDGGNILEGVASMDTPPEFVTSEGGGIKMNKLSRWVFDLCVAQQERIESLEERLSALERQQ